MLLVVPYFCPVKHKFLLFDFSAFAENLILHDIPTAECCVKFAKLFAMFLCGCKVFHLLKFPSCPLNSLLASDFHNFSFKVWIVVHFFFFFFYL